MDESKQSLSPDLPINRYAAVLAVFWTLILASSLVWNVIESKQNTLQGARIEARIAYERDVAYRNWNAGHGGVYVAVTKETQPNPYLSNIPERDITTPSGKVLTLVTSAHMTRQVVELDGGLPGVRGHITSLKPVRPENAPDPWETTALAAFERGQTEVSAIARIDGKDYLRLMRPLVAERACLTCHANQGYVEGDIRGGVSVSVPMEPLVAIERKLVLGSVMGHGVLWTFGLLGLVLGARQLSRSQQERARAQAALRDSDTLYHSLVENLPQNIFRKDLQSRFTFANQRFCESTGKPLSEVLGKTDTDFFAADLAEKYRQDDVRVMESGQSFETVEEHALAGGERRWVQVSKTPLRDSRNHVIGLQCIFWDVTVQKRAELALRESEERFRLLVDGVKDYAIFLLDPGGRVLTWNSGAERLIGYRSEEIVGQHFSKFYSAEDVKSGNPERALQVAATAEGRYGEEGWRVRKDGSRIWADVIITALRDDAANVRGFVKVTRDVTERKQAEEALRRSNTDLEQFAYVASHDLQEPLRAVAGCVQLLQARCQGKFDATSDELVQHAVEGAERMKGLIEDLLEYSRVTTRGKALTATSSGAALDGALANLAVALQESGALVTRDAMPIVNADPTQLRQLFQNLIGNAVKFRAARVPCIHVGAERQDRQWEFSVRDNGIGLEPQYAERIFVIFQRLHTRREYSGTGIGLAVCKKIAERHGGRIWVESEPGQGSIFRFTIPDREMTYGHRQETIGDDPVG